MLCVFHYNFREYITLHTPCSRAKQNKGKQYSEAKQSLPRRKAAKSLNKDRLLRDNEQLYSKFITNTATICLQPFHSVL